jgi:hypothetical protein
MHVYLPCRPFRALASFVLGTRAAKLSWLAPAPCQPCSLVSPRFRSSRPACSTIQHSFRRVCRSQLVFSLPPAHPLPCQTQLPPVFEPSPSGCHTRVCGVKRARSHPSRRHPSRPTTTSPCPFQRPPFTHSPTTAIPQTNVHVHTEVAMHPSTCIRPLALSTLHCLPVPLPVPAPRLPPLNLALACHAHAGR